MLSDGRLSPGRTLCMGSPNLALLPPGCIAVCSVVGREKKSPGTVAASRGLNIPEPSPRRGRVWTDLFRCRNHLETRIARIPSKVKHQFVGSCQLSVRVIFDSVCQLWGCRTAAASATGRQTKPTKGRPGPPANESRASRSPDPRKGPGERGAGRRRRPGSEGRSPSPRRGGGAARGEQARAAASAKSRGQRRRGPQPEPRRARSSAPRRASTNPKNRQRGPQQRPAARRPRARRRPERAQGPRKGPKARPDDRAARGETPTAPGGARGRRRRARADEAPREGREGRG